MTLRSFVGALALYFALFAQPVAAYGEPTFDRALWKADFERMKAALAQGYANLDWQVSYRGKSLKRADQQIGSMLDRVNSDAEAILVFNKLIEAFDDPHLALQFGPAPHGAAVLPIENSVAGPSGTCSSGDQTKLKPKLPYSTADGWKETSGPPFTSGVVGGIGFVRVPSFDEMDYAEFCGTSSTEGSYDDRLALRKKLNVAFVDTLENLRTAGAQTLALDLSGNGGGSEWSTEMAGLLGKGQLQRIMPRRVQPTCDRSGIWRGEDVCSPYLPEETEIIAGSNIWSGPIILLVDGNTASAAEEIVTWLKDNGQAKIIGMRTYGAGCGYIDGGNAFNLRAANVHLMMPNCSRFTKAGLNEIEGIAPDYLIDWKVAEPSAVISLIESAATD